MRKPGRMTHLVQAPQRWGPQQGQQQPHQRHVGAQTLALLRARWPRTASPSAAQLLWRHLLGWQRVGNAGHAGWINGEKSRGEMRWQSGDKNTVHFTGTASVTR